MSSFYSDVEPFSKYYPVMLHLFPATRIENENLACPRLKVRFAWVHVLVVASTFSVSLTFSLSSKSQCVNKKLVMVYFYSCAAEVQS